MTDADEATEIELVPKTTVLYHGGSRLVFNTPEEILTLIDDADSDGLVELSTFNWIGDPRDLKMDPCSVWLRPHAIEGMGQVTRAWWKDHLRDQKHSAIAPQGQSVLGAMGIG